MKRNEEELTVITKTYDLILWSCNHTSRFPRDRHDNTATVTGFC